MTRARLYTWPVIALIATGAVPVSAGQAAFEGVYIASGVDAEGNHYRRAVDIERHGDRFSVTWVEADVVGQAIILQPTWVGVGIVNGDTLSVSFVADDTLGIMVYTFGGDGQVSGRWTLAGDDEEIYSETLTKLPDTLLEPGAAEPSQNHSHPPSSPSAATVSL